MIADGAEIQISDVNGNLTQRISVGKNQTESDAPNNPFIAIYMNDKIRTYQSASGFYLFDEYGNMRLNAEMTQNNMPHLSVFDYNGKLRAALGNIITINNSGQNISRPESSFLLFDDEGHSIFNATNE